MTTLCSAAGCFMPATTHAAYCSRHNGRRARHGHFNGRGLNRDLLPFYRRTRDVLHPLRQSHEGVKAACDELDALRQRWASNEREGAPLRSYERELVRLLDHGIDALDIIEAASAVLLFDSERPHALRNQRSLQFAMARFVCALAPLRGARLGASTALPMAEFLTSRYGGLFLVIQRRFEEERAHNERRAQAMATPIAFNG